MQPLQCKCKCSVPLSLADACDLFFFSYRSQEQSDKQNTLRREEKGRNALRLPDTKEEVVVVLVCC